MRFLLFSLISFIALTLLFVPNKANAGSLNWTSYSTNHYAPYVESSCYNNYSYLSTCNNTNWAYVNSTPIASGTLTSINQNWNSGSIIPDGSTNIGSNRRMLVITGYWQHPGTAGQTSTVYFAGRNDDGLIVNINNTAVISDWAQQGPTYWNSYGSFTGVGGQWYPIVINWYEWGGSANMDIHYRIDGSNGIGTTSGWLDHNSNMFSSTEPSVSITSGQTTILNNAMGVTGNGVKLSIDGDNNTVHIEQEGEDNFIVGTDWTSNATINGDSNTVTIDQGNVTTSGSLSDNNGIAMGITGNSNTLTISQGDANNDRGEHRIWTDITGNSNNVNILQKDHGGNCCHSEHFLSLDLDASSNTINLTQKNDGNKVMFLDINNNSNTIDIMQQNTGEHYLDLTLSSGDYAHDVDITQSGSAAKSARITLGGYSYNFDLIQQGSSTQSYSVDSTCGSAGGCTLSTTQGN